ncbi:Nibrin Nijmegen breakage syndrome protein 1 -like protein [Collichthys lucidus]|uniref:Nibrin n=1 Tax=Collichthys lucidus TaxID=240159 RepID=A0A4V6AQV8_COLLU|nr:Nibrin Nijmegen breakage syndrome protein 1 -like protein [Collichthys lucidus]
MWILTPLQPGGETHYLLSSKDYVVGRKNCDILLPSDQSISRAHAHLTATGQTLTLKDTSKYGTFVNGQQLTANTPANLKSGDNVTFGVFESKFSVEHQKPVVCSSCLDNDGKTSLTQALLAVGGKLVNTWTQDCTHLVMPTAKVTIKTICALLCCRPIVKPEFFSELGKAAQQKLPPPKAESFIPEIDEPSLSKEDVNLGAIPVRKQLFAGKTFIFLSAKQLKRLSAAVGFGGGRSQLLEEGSLPRDVLESPQSCVIDATTGSSQPLLSSSTTEWANTVKNIVQRKGLRVIAESEIGLAAIYASCDQYCNPSRLITDSESLPKVNPRIPSASMSQSVAVDETVLPAASQNITAYVANTEQSQGCHQAFTDTRPLTELSRVTVGETPEKKQNQNTSQLRGSKPVAPKTASQCIVADTMSVSFNTVEDTYSQRKKPESKPTGAGSSGVRSQQSFPRTNGGPKTFLQRQSPQKPKNSAEASPQKQSTLTTFFQPINKKRPLEDECFFSEMSEPKRPALESSVSTRAANTSVMSKETPSRSGRVSAAASASDLFGGQSEVRAVAVKEEPRSRKRKEMEEEIQMDELESIMSEDMDCFDEQPSINEGKQAQPVLFSSTGKKEGLNTVEASSSSKRPKVHLEENGTNKRPQLGLETESGSSIKKNSQKSEQRIVSIKTEPVHPLESRTTLNESSKRREVPSASTSTNNEPFEDDASFIEDLELLAVDICQPKEETKTVEIKQEVQESKIGEDENLPKKLVLVEFRSLTVGAPPKTKPQQPQNNGYAKNFKCFRKNNVPGRERSSHIIGGSDLLVHNRGKNTDLDEWLKDAAEEERRSKRDETIGDDLFRYNPTKLSKRR